MQPRLLHVRGAGRGGLHHPFRSPPAEREQEQYEAAAKRRGIRLVRAGRKGLEDASSLKEDMLTALQHSTDAEA